MNPTSGIALNRKTVMITGASSGIGLELAKLFSTARWNLVLTARSLGPLESVAAGCTARDGIEAAAIQADLSASGAAKELFDEVESRHLTVDALINNAGFGAGGDFADQDPFTVASMLQVNIAALTQLTHLFIQPMLKKGWGRIMNVASTAAFVPGPYMAEYYATKAYVLSFSEAIGKELEGTGVTVTTLCPGPTHTNFQKRAGLEKSRLFSSAAMSAESVAKAGYEAMLEGKRLAVPGLRNKLLSSSARFAPRSMILKVVGRLNESR